MQITWEEAVRRYNMIRDEVKSKFPEQWQIVIELCKAVPDQIDIDTVWKAGRDKPCFSNITINLGERIARDLGYSNDLQRWKKIASDGWSITMRKGGRSWKANENFEIHGQEVKNFVSSLSPGGLRSYTWRLYSIRELALALEAGRVTACIQSLINFVETEGGLPPDEAEKWSSTFGRQAGRGWGHTTAYHMLTDLGVSVKPDMHLTISAIRMGLLSPDYPSNLPEQELKNIINLKKVQHLAAKRVMNLSKHITPTACPGKKRSAMREVDKILMEWSRQGLARPL